MKIEKQCIHCNKPFMADQRELNRGKSKYCSLSCAGRHSQINTTINNFVCKHCGQQFESKSKDPKYCSMSCKQKHYRVRSKSDTEQSMKTITRNFPIKECEICKWKESICDLHHIVPVSQGGKNELNNLISVCPNHHRMIHKNLISQDYLQQIVNVRLYHHPK